MKAEEWSSEHYSTILKSTPHLDVEDLTIGLRMLSLRLQDAAEALDSIAKIEEETWLT